MAGSHSHRSKSLEVLAYLLGTGRERPPGSQTGKKSVMDESKVRLRSLDVFMGIGFLAVGAFVGMTGLSPIMHRS